MSAAAQAARRPASHLTPHLESLADEAITIIREVATECENPVLLFSGGKEIGRAHV